MEKPNLPKIGAFKPLSFLKEVKIELSKVVWPTKKETIKLTTIVIVVSIVVGFFIGLLDFLFTNLITLIIKK